MYNSTKLYPIYIFDFDGTLLHSNEAKNNAFMSLAHTRLEKNYMQALLKDKKLDRYQIIELFCKSTKYSYDDSIYYFEFNLEKTLKNAKVRIGAKYLLSQLIDSKALLFISSATPDAPLKRLVNFHFPRTFDNNNIYGSSIDKYNAINDIIKRMGCKKNNLIFIGDGKDDYDAAQLSTIDFCAINGGTLEEANPSLVFIKDLTHVHNNSQH